MNKIITKLLEKLGLIPPIENEVNQPCYDKYGRFLGWYSRSVAAAVFTFCKDKEGNWYVLGSERGEEAADFKGYWNCICGYLDHSETLKAAAAREALEECGVELEETQLEFVGYEDSPTANRQNVTFRFAAVINDRTIDSFKFSKKGNEGKEVGDIKWIKIENVDHYKWAFNHDERIKEIYEKVVTSA